MPQPLKEHPALPVETSVEQNGSDACSCTTGTRVRGVVLKLLIWDLIRRGEREGRKIEAVREKVRFKAGKKNHAR
jgi:hypothetical protein